MNIPHWLDLNVFIGIAGIILALIALYYSSKEVYFAKKTHEKENKKANLTISFFLPKESDAEEYYFAVPFDKYPYVLITFPIMIANIGEQRAKEVEVMFSASNGLIPIDGWKGTKISPRFVEVKTKKTKLNQLKTAYAYKINYLGPKEGASIELPFVASGSTEHVINVPLKDGELSLKVHFAFVFEIECVCENNIAQKINKKITIIFINGKINEAIKFFKENNNKVKKTIWMKTFRLFNWMYIFNPSGKKNDKKEICFDMGR